jgi:hypothetical protein
MIPWDAWRSNLALPFLARVIRETPSRDRGGGRATSNHRGSDSEDPRPEDPRFPGRLRGRDGLRRKAHPEPPPSVADRRDPPGFPPQPRPKALPRFPLPNDATMRLCRADLPAVAHFIAARSRSHQQQPARTGGRDGLRRKAHPESPPSVADRSDSQAFHLGPAQRPGLALHYLMARLCVFADLSASGGADLPAVAHFIAAGSRSHSVCPRRPYSSERRTARSAVSRHQFMKHPGSAKSASSTRLGLRCSSRSQRVPQPLEPTRCRQPPT